VTTPAREVAYATVRRTFEDGAYTDRALAGEADRAGLDARDRALATHLAYGTVQRRRTLDAALETLANRAPEGLEPPLANALRLGAFELLFAEGIPARATVSETVDLVRAHVGARATGLANAVLRRVAERGGAWYAGLGEATPGEAGVRHSLPDWLCRLWFMAYGAEHARALCAAANRPPETCLRPNALRAADGQVEGILEAAGVPFRRDDETGALVLGGPFAFARSPLYGEGFAVPQSRASIQAGARVGAGPGMRVLDLCAAPGGKTSQLAAAGAEVTAVEINPGRARALRETLARLGADVRVVEGDARAFEERGWDAILLDAPCTGTGVLAGRPDARWRRRATDVEALAALQAEMLRHAVTLLRPGGCLVYAVCTLSPAENDGAVRAAGLEPRDERWTWPDRDGTDGFYTAETGEFDDRTAD
jgi:16S rRNA (cytosine967-C5)-methyltransferase